MAGTSQAWPDFSGSAFKAAVSILPRLRMENWRYLVEYEGKCFDDEDQRLDILTQDHAADDNEHVAQETGEDHKGNNEEQVNKKNIRRQEVDKVMKKLMRSAFRAAVSILPRLRMENWRYLVEYEGKCFDDEDQRLEILTQDHAADDEERGRQETVEDNKGNMEEQVNKRNITRQEVDKVMKQSRG